MRKEMNDTYIVGEENIKNYGKTKLGKKSVSEKGRKKCMMKGVELSVE